MGSIDDNQNNDASRVTIDGGGASRHFTISGADTDVNLVDLSLVSGGDGGLLAIAGGNTIIRASTDADAAAEVEIKLTGVKTLTAGDVRFRCSVDRRVHILPRNRRAQSTSIAGAGHKRSERLFD